MSTPSDFFSSERERTQKAKLSYKEAVRLELETHKAISGKIKQDQIEATMARFGLKEDLGELEGHQTIYDMDDDTRDRLIAHARQDAALAYYSSNNTKRAVIGLRRLVWLFGLVNIALLGLILMK